MQIRPRSGLALRHGILLPNSPGTIDEDYRGEIQVIVLNAGDAPFTIERFREVLGVKAGTYKLGPDFQRFVIDPAVLEVNGLSDLGVQIRLDRKHIRAPFHAVTMAWWRKSPEDFRNAQRERNRSKIGRMARLKGAVETVTPHAALALPAA